MKPKSVRVLGKPFSIRFVEKNDLTDDLGACAEDSQEITIRQGLKLETEQDTVLHEIMHAIDHQMEAKLSEKQVGRMATGLLAVFKDNPEFMKYLSK